MDKKRINLLLGGKKKAWSVAFNGTNTNINAGSETSIDNLHANEMTAEGWFNLSIVTGARYFFEKIGGGGGVGWYLLWTGTNLTAVSYYDTPSTASVSYNPNNIWEHFAITFSNITDKKIKIFKNGTLIKTGNEASGLIKSDASNNFNIGSLIGSVNAFSGNVGWIRLSNSIRYTTSFTPLSRFKYPLVDANTVRLFKLNEGTGATIIDYSSNAQNATLSNGTWEKL
jgi:hypothetical protein